MNNRFKLLACSLVILMFTALVRCSDEKSTGSDDEVTTYDNRIVYSTHYEGMYLINADSSGKKLLVDDDSCTTVVWSPDKTRVAFYRLIPGSGYQIRVVDTATLAVQYIAYGTYGHNPWSPDGNTLVYDNNNSVNTKAFGSVSSVPVLSNAIDAVFLKNDTLIMLYSPSGNMDSTFLYRVADDGTGLTALSDSAGYRYLLPRLSPNRSKIAYIRIPYDYNGNYEIWLINVNGTGDEKLAEFEYQIPCLAFSWDGANLFTVPSQIDDNQLYMLNIATKTGFYMSGFNCLDGDNVIDCAPDQNNLAVTLDYKGIGIVDYVHPGTVDTISTIGIQPNW